MSVAELRIVEILPRLLGTYGDGGNAVVLARRAAARGARAERVTVEPGQAVPHQADLYLLGGGEDGAQELAAGLLRSDTGLGDAVARGAPVLAVCAGLQLLGQAFPVSDGRLVAGLGLVDATAMRLSARAVGEVVAVADPDVGGGLLVGFENHRAGSRLGGAARPLGQVTRGVGNGVAGGDGLLQGSVVGTYLHGPVLALNPGLADHLLSRVLGRLEPLDDGDAERVREGRLRPGPTSRWRRAMRRAPRFVTAPADPSRPVSRPVGDGTTPR